MGEPGKRLARYILRPPLAQERLHLLPNNPMREWV